MTLFDLVPDAPRLCSKCDGTILAPTIDGVPRGTCHCPENLSRPANRITDWNAESVQIARLPWVTRQDPRDCCKKVIVRYEGVDHEMAIVAKQRGGVALHCEKCHSRVTFSDGRWWREGPPA